MRRSDLFVRSPHQASTEATVRRQRADLASSAGAGILGFGLGALFAGRVAGLAVPTILVGGALHGWVMLAKRALEPGADVPEPRWSRILYWGCWIALALLAMAIGWRLLW